MKLMNRKQNTVCIVLLIVLAITLCVAFWIESPKGIQQPKKEEGKVQFSVGSGMYTEALTLELGLQGAKEIWYTLDGSIPSKDNKTALQYDSEQGILLQCGAKERIYTVKAVAYTDEGAITDSCSKTYILGSDVEARYCTPVLSLSGAYEDFFDENTGILVGENRLLKGAESEKPVQITLFDEQGVEVLNQKGGFRVYGCASRQKNQPSFRLYARSEYDEENDFHYLFFDNQFNYENALISKFKRIIVRNSGDDNGFAYLRNELASRLSLDAGFADAQCAAPVCVYINGEYYGQYWFMTNYDDWYFANKYGAYDGQMVILEGVIALIEEQEDEDAVEQQIREEYNALHEYIAYADLNEDDNWEALNARIDVENFLQYVAIQNCVNNGDAFLNNFRTYRYYSPKDEYQEGTVFDGRYRFLLYDMDESFGFGESSDVSILTTRDRVTNEIFYNQLFNNILKRPEGRDYYIRYYLSLANYYFATERATAIMEEMHESRARELQYLYDETDLLVGNAFTPEEVDYQHALEQLDIMRDFLESRPQHIIWDVKETFDMHQDYALTVLNENEANITVDFATFHDKSFTGTYYAEVPVIVTATPKCGYRFDYWLVNGKVFEEESLEIVPDMIEQEKICIECVTSPDDTKDLYITAIKCKGSNDYVELTNLGQKAVNLKHYFLSDGPKNWNASSLPAVDILPNQRIVVYCKSYRGVEASGKPGVDFNIKEGESVNLYRSNGELLQSVVAPDLGSKEHVYRMNPYSGEFFETQP